MSVLSVQDFSNQEGLPEIPKYKRTPSVPSPNSVTWNPSGEQQKPKCAAANPMVSASLTEKLGCIDVLMTGGTIAAQAYNAGKAPPKKATMLGDSERNPLKDVTNQMCAQTGVKAIFTQLKPVDSQDLFESKINFESRDGFVLTDKGQEVVDAIKKLADAKSEQADITEAVPKKVLLTMGTDTMIWFANRLSKMTFSIPMDIVITGAMLPLANGPRSDGHRNLEKAIHALARMDGYANDVYANLAKPYASQVNTTGADRQFSPRVVISMGGAIHDPYGTKKDISSTGSDHFCRFVNP